MRRRWRWCVSSEKSAEWKLRPEAGKKERVMGEWTDETIIELSRLWLEGLSATKIGKKLGFSKNAVAGKAHRVNLPMRGSPIGQYGNRYGASGARTPRPKLCRIPKKENALKVFETMPVKALDRVSRPQVPPSLLGKTKGHREMPFGIGTLSGIDFTRIKAPPKGRCAWPFTCANPTDGHLCDVHRGLIRQAA
jgi:hypothetical protein